MATDIYKQVLGQQNMSMGAVVGVILTIPAIVAFIIDSISKSKADSESISSKAVAFKPVENKKRDIGYFIYSLFVTALVAVMFVVIALAAFAKRWPYNLTFTLEHF